MPNAEGKVLQIQINNKTIIEFSYLNSYLLNSIIELVLVGYEELLKPRFVLSASAFG